MTAAVAAGEVARGAMEDAAGVAMGGDGAGPGSNAAVAVGVGVGSGWDVGWGVALGRGAKSIWGSSEG